MIKLQNHPLLLNVGLESMTRLTEGSQRLKVNKGDIIFHQEAVAQYVYFVSQGTVKILKTSSNGQEKIFSLYQGGQFIALSTLFNPPHVYPATAVVVEGGIVIKVPREALERAILSTEAATRDWFRQLNRRLEGVQQLLTDQVFIDAKERFKKWLQRFATIQCASAQDVVLFTLPVTKQEVADLLSIRRETFSRLLTELKEEGVCEVKGKDFKVSRKWLEEM